MSDDLMIHWKARVNTSTSSASGSTTATPTDTSVSATDEAAYYALCRGTTDHARDRTYQATKRHIVVGKRCSNSERPEVRESIANDTSRISTGISEPISPEMPRTPLLVKPTENVAATVQRIMYVCRTSPRSLSTASPTALASYVMHEMVGEAEAAFSPLPPFEARLRHSL